jgi:hypothetical protein
MKTLRQPELGCYELHGNWSLQYQLKMFKKWCLYYTSSSKFTIWTDVRFPINTKFRAHVKITVIFMSVYITLQLSTGQYFQAVFNFCTVGTRAVGWLWLTNVRRVLHFFHARPRYVLSTSPAQQVWRDCDRLVTTNCWLLTCLQSMFWQPFNGMLCRFEYK